MTRFLKSTWQLHDVRDVEAFVCSTIARSKYKYLLELDEAEDLVSHCFLAIWRASERLDRSRGSFSTLATIITHRTITDYLRKTRVRTTWKFGNGHVHHRTPPQLVPFTELDPAHPTSTSHPQDDCNPDLQRVLTAGNSARARDYAVLGLQPPR